LANVHGHLHNNQPQGHLGHRYYNVCVEMLDYTPIALEDLRVILRTQHETWQHIQAALEHGVFV
jgi:calcineurin-like phosphoesterase family protein